KLRARLSDELATKGVHTVLYSSEFFYLAPTAQLKQLRDHVAGQDAVLQVVVYVRDIVGHAVSSYSQVVKRALFTGGF
ncbi:hypothetical protein GUF73_11090, partial [Xanthomonas citri pv. citri]|nr:hypothetical protein [Xanthomonas citri pv. citri]